MSLWVGSRSPATTEPPAPAPRAAAPEPLAPLEEEAKPNLSPDEESDEDILEGVRSLAEDAKLGMPPFP